LTGERPEPEPTAAAGPRRGLREAFERIGEFVELRLPHTHAAGAALAVTDADAVLGVVVRGFADAASGAAVRPETRFQIGSISKSFAAILALQEAEAGRLDLHAPVREALPWLELREPFGPITLHHLLTHSSGLPIGTEHSAEDRFAAWALRLLEPGFPPGSRFHYSNDGYKLVGLAVERAAGGPVPDLLRDRIFARLGMSASEGAITNDTRSDLATGYRTMYDDRPPQEGHPLVPAPWTLSDSADGSIVSDVLDMGAYARMLLARGTHPGGRLVSEAGFAALTSPHIDDEDEPGFGYGYGLWIGEAGSRRRWKHSGGMVGFTAQLTIDVGSGLAAVMLLNGDGNREAAVDFALDVVRAAIAGEDLPAVGPEPDPSRTSRAAGYAGIFRSHTREIALVASGGRLLLRERGGVDAALVPEEDEEDTFLVPDARWDRFRLGFVRDGGGSIVAAVHGADRFEAHGAIAPEAPRVPEAWRSYVGHYRSWNPWMPSFRVVARAGRLVFAASSDVEEFELVPAEGGSFRVGKEPWRPGRIRFDTIVDGAALRALYDGGAWYRSFTP
jgi:CubicO group peptidase (beta-lactamase class C family)